MTKDLAIKILRGEVLGTKSQTDEAVSLAVSALQSEPKQGRWIVQDGAVRCSECGEPNIEWDYCPNCGAIMKEVEG